MRTPAVPVPDHEEIRRVTPEELGALVDVVTKALTVAVAYDRDASAIASEMGDLMGALQAARATWEQANERRAVERVAEIAALEQRFGPELWE